MADASRRGRDLIGMPVYTVREGRQVGEVQALMVRRADSTLAAVGIRTAEGVRRLRFSDLKSVGPDAVMLESESVLENEPPAADLEELDTGLVGRPVLTESGQKLGVIAGIRLDTRDGRIETYRVEASEGMFAHLAALMTGDRLEIPVSRTVSVGPDCLVVRDEATAPDGGEGAPEPLPPG